MICNGNSYFLRHLIYSHSTPQFKKDIHNCINTVILTRNTVSMHIQVESPMTPWNWEHAVGTNEVFGLASGQPNYGKSPYLYIFILGLPIINGDFPVCYVNVDQRVRGKHQKEAVFAPLLEELVL